MNAFYYWQDTSVCNQNSQGVKNMNAFIRKDTSVKSKTHKILKYERFLLKTSQEFE